MTYNRWLWVSLSIKFKLSNILRTGSTALNPACVAALLVDSFHKYSESIVHCAPPNVRSPICTRFLLRLIPWNHFVAWIQFSFSVLKMGVAKRHHVNSPATTWIQCAIKRSHLLGHVFGPLIQLLDMYSHKKVFEELRFGQVREEGAGHTGTSYEGYNWLLQTVDTDTDHHVRKKTLHPLGMNRHKHQRKNHAQRTTQTSTSKDSIMHTAQSSFELYQ